MYEREHAHVFNYAHCMVGAIKASPIIHDMNDPLQILKIVFMYARHHTDFTKFTYVWWAPYTGWGKDREINTGCILGPYRNNRSHCGRGYA